MIDQLSVQMRHDKKEVREIENSTISVGNMRGSRMPLDQKVRTDVSVSANDRFVRRNLDNGVSSQAFCCHKKAHVKM